MATEYELVVVGSGAVGKSALTVRLVKNEFTEAYDPTIEDSHRKQCQVDGKAAILNILDTAGQEEFSLMRDQHMKEGEGFLIVYSITSRGTFLDADKFIQQIKKVKAAFKHEGMIPMVLVGNKSDMVDAREVPTKEGQQLADRYKIPFFETSAKMCVKVEDSFYQLVREVRKSKGEKVADTAKSGCCVVM